MRRNSPFLKNDHLMRDPNAALFHDRLQPEPMLPVQSVREQHLQHHCV
jgi:hypothetical protein